MLPSGDMKTCQNPECGKEFEPEQRPRPVGRAQVCCSNECQKMRNYIRGHQDLILRWSKKTEQSCRNPQCDNTFMPDRRKGSQRAYCSDACQKTYKPYRSYENKLRAQYGITLEHRDKLLESQNNVCAICLKPGPDAVDHNHITGKVRGILHKKCNSALGMLEDDFENVLRAAKYLCEQDGVI